MISPRRHTHRGPFGRWLDHRKTRRQQRHALRCWQNRLDRWRRLRKRMLDAGHPVEFAGPRPELMLDREQRPAR